VLDPVQQRLSEEVRNLVLVSEVGQTFARQQGESGLLESMTRSARILFDFENAAVLLENPTGQALVGAPVANQQRIAEFAIPLGQGQAPAQLPRSNGAWPSCAATGAAGLPEEQLLRMLGTEALVCVPLVAGSALPGRAGWRRRRLAAAGLPEARTLPAVLRQPGRRARWKRRCRSAATHGASSPAWPRNTAKPRAAWCTK
jgi:hypothetical protein